MKVGLKLLWPALKRVPKARWLLTIPALIFALDFASSWWTWRFPAGSAAMYHEQYWQEHGGSTVIVPRRIGLLRAAASYDCAFTEQGGLFSSAIILALTATLWLRTLRGKPRAPSSDTGERTLAVFLTVLIALALTVLVVLVLAWMFVPLRSALTAPSLAVARMLGMALESAWAAMLFGGFGFLLREGTSSPRQNWRRATDGALLSFWPLFIVFSIYKIPGALGCLWMSFAGSLGGLPLRLQCSAFQVVPMAQLVLVAWPFVIVVERVGAGAALKRAWLFYKRAWPGIVPLVLVTLLLMWPLYTVVARLRQSPAVFSTLTGRLHIFGLELLGVALSSVAVVAMFLLIDEWRGRRKADSLGDGRHGIG